MRNKVISKTQEVDTSYFLDDCDEWVKKCYLCRYCRQDIKTSELICIRENGCKRKKRKNDG